MLQGRSLSNDMQTVFMPVCVSKIPGLEFEIEIEIARAEHILFYDSCGTHSIFRYFLLEEYILFWYFFYSRNTFYFF